MKYFLQYTGINSKFVEQTFANTVVTVKDREHMWENHGVSRRNNTRIKFGMRKGEYLIINSGALDRTVANWIESRMYLNLASAKNSVWHFYSEINVDIYEFNGMEITCLGSYNYDNQAKKRVFIGKTS